MKYRINTFLLIERLRGNLVVGLLNIMDWIQRVLIVKYIRILMNFEIRMKKKKRKFFYLIMKNIQKINFLICSKTLFFGLIENKFFF